MYKTNAGQASLFDDPANFIGARLNPNNRWVQMSSMIPWDLLDEKYNAQFRNKKVGNPAKAARMALGSHIIKEKFGISDQETVEHIKEHISWKQTHTRKRQLPPLSRDSTAPGKEKTQHQRLTRSLR